MSEERLALLRGIAEREPKDALAQYGFGRASLTAGRLEDAIAALSSAVRLDPGYSAAYRDLGRAQLERGDLRESIETLRRGIPMARERGDLQTVREMEVFLRRAERRLER